MNLVEVFRRFPTQDDCVAYLEGVRWGGTSTCPYCGAQRSSVMLHEERHRHHCNACNRSFKVTVGTIFHGTHLPLQKWFLALALILNAKKGVSSLQLAGDIEVNKNTAWRMQMQVRKATADQGDLLTGIIEMDEVFVGGKPRPANHRGDDDAPKHKRGRGTSKTPVVGTVERGGRVRAKVMKRDELRGPNLAALVRGNVDVAASLVITDEYMGYAPLRQFIDHFVVNHSQRYADGFVHTNTIEGFWALLKRAIVGQYHKVSIRHLPAYVAEVAYKYSNRKHRGLFEATMARAVGVS